MTDEQKIEYHSERAMAELDLALSAKCHEASPLFTCVYYSLVVVKIQRIGSPCRGRIGMRKFGSLKRCCTR